MVNVAFCRATDNIPETRCSGGLPRCHECETNDLLCTYEQGRRDRLKELLEQRQSLVALVKEMRKGASEKDRRKIEATLEAVRLLEYCESNLTVLS